MSDVLTNEECPDLKQALLDRLPPEQREASESGTWVFRAVADGTRSAGVIWARASDERGSSVIGALSVRENASEALRFSDE